MAKETVTKISLRESWKRYLPALAVFLLMTTLATVGTWYAGNRDRAVERERFVATSETELDNFVEEAVDRKTDLQSLVRSYVLASGQNRLTRTEYQPRLNLLFENIGGRSGDLARADIILRVNDADRVAFEEELSRSFGAPVQISSIDNAGVKTRTGGSEVYFPVVFVEPAKLSSLYVGVDAQSIHALANEIQQSTKTGQPAFTGPLLGSAITNAGDGYAVLAPIYSPGTEPAKGKAASAEPLGFAIGYQLYETLLGQINEEETGLCVCLYDTGSENPDKPIATNQPEGPELKNERLSLQRKDGISQIRTIDNGDHVWTVVSTPEGPFVVGKMFWYSMGFSALFMTLLGIYLLSSVRRSIRIEETEAALHESYDSLSASAMALEVRAQQLALLADMSDMLQASERREDALKTIKMFMPQIFTGTSGAVYFLDAKTGLAMSEVMWGEGQVEESFPYNTCSALRKVDGAQGEGEEADSACGHAGGLPPANYLCVPMLEQGQLLGLFYVSAAREMSRETKRMAQAVTENMRLALTNINLRANLREQSITDPLTKLFNRRFMEELFEREIRRAERHKTGIGVIIMDIDWFKKVNDTYGHTAGDIVLATLADFLKNNVRAEDYVCRYGGEEFLLLLPGSNKQDTMKRAEDLRVRAAELEFIAGGQNIGPLNLSGGVAEYPDDGADRDAVFIAADDALYMAKETGRNRVVAAGPASRKKGKSPKKGSDG